MVKTSFGHQLRMGDAGRPHGLEHHVYRPSTFFPFSSSFVHSAFSSSSQPGSASHDPALPPTSSFPWDSEGNNISSPLILFSDLCGPQERWTDASGHRPFPPEQAPSRPNLQDGNCLQNRQRLSRAPLGMHHRPTRCLFPRSCRLALSYVPGIRGGRQGIRFSVPPLRPGVRPLGIFQDHQACQGPPPPHGSAHQFIPGRFPTFKPIFRGSSPQPVRGLIPVQKVGDSCQTREIPPCTIPESVISGCPLPPGHHGPFAPISEDCIDLGPLSGDARPISNVPSLTREPFGDAQLCLRPASSWSSLSSASHPVDEFPYFPIYQGSSCPPGPILQVPTSGVVRTDLSFRQGSDVHPHSHTSTDDGCFGGRLERCPTPRRPQDRGSLASELKFLLDELARAPGCIPVARSLPPSASGSFGPHHDGQHDGRLMPASAGYPTVRDSDVSLQGHFGILPPPWHHSGSQTPSRMFERSCGSGFSFRSGFHRVVYRQPHLRMAVPRIWSVSGRPIRHSRQQEGSVVHFSLSGRPGFGSQCPLPSLGRLGPDLPLPSHGRSPSGCGPPAQVQGKGRPHCSLSRPFGLVPCPASQGSQSLSSSSGPLPLPDNQQGHNLPFQPTPFQTSRVDTVRSALRAAGYSDSSIDLLLQAHKFSTTRQYQTAWRVFLNFLESRGLSSKDVSLPVVCDFLTDLVITLDREYRTIAVYKCALRHPILYACRLDIHEDISILFMRGVFNSRPPRRASPMPSWSLNGVLSFICSQEFEPLEDSSFIRLTQKTLFLILLASGRRISEVAHISRTSVQRPDSSLSLLWVPGFRPKHYSPDFVPSPPSISCFAFTQPIGRLLCPVRAYHIYWQRSHEWLDDVPLSQRHRPFLWSHPDHALHHIIGSLTKWFISLIKDCRQRDGLSLDIRIGPHQTRKFAGSYSAQAGHDMQRVRKVMGFSSLTILKKNYIANVPPLIMPCVLPGGSFAPLRERDFSSSDE